MSSHNNHQHNQNNLQNENNTEDDIFTVRRQKLAELAKHQKSAYPNDFVRKDFCQDLQNSFADKTKDVIEGETPVQVSVAGRLIRNRGAFLVIKDMTGTVQLYVDRKGLDVEALALIKSADLGDIVGAKGYIGRSGKGDLYVHLQSFVILTKSLRPLPDKFHGLTDTEAKYRKRYLDLMVNDDTRRTFLVRSHIIAKIREFMQTRRFLEVETPMMHVIPGGAAARPFLTHHNALDMPLFLRIAPELYLKRLVIGGFERVFEINRNFRNEGVSTRHNPEFTMMEFYEAFADYKDAMVMTETLLSSLALDVLGTTDVVYQGESLSFATPFAKITMTDAICAQTDINQANVHNLEFMREYVQNTLHIDVGDNWGLGKLQTLIFEETVEHTLRMPTFITQYPAETSPLARKNDDNAHITDRFELFIGGREIANGFSELNDSADQAARFADQVAQKDAGDDEAMHFDSDYIEALEYGLPPCAGCGIGIDRLVMLLTDAPSIRDVILFPHMRKKG